MKYLQGRRAERDTVRMSESPPLVDGGMCGAQLPAGVKGRPQLLVLCICLALCVSQLSLGSEGSSPPPQRVPVDSIRARKTAAEEETSRKREGERDGHRSYCGRRRDERRYKEVVV